MLPPQSDSPDPLSQLPEEQAELLWVCGLTGPDLLTPLVAHAMESFHEDQVREEKAIAELEAEAGFDSRSLAEMESTHEARVRDAPILLRTFAEKGLISHTAGTGGLPDRWSLTSEQAEFLHHLLVAHVTAIHAQINPWINVDREGGTPPESVEPEEEVMEARLRMAATVRARVQESGARHTLAAASYNLGHVLCDAGRFADALAAFEEAEQLYAETGDEAWRSIAAQKAAEARHRTEA